MKTCSRCKIEKAPAEFMKSSGNKDGLHCWCKPCHKKWDQDRKANKPFVPKGDNPYNVQQKLQSEGKKLYLDTLAESGLGLCTHCFSIKDRTDFGVVSKYRKRQCKECAKGYYRYKNYGLSQEAFQELLNHQGGCCAICHVPDPNGAKDWCIDHDHDTGEVRGLLCNNCNRALGLWGDSADTLRAAISYLKRPPCQQVHSGLKVAG